MIIQVPCLNIDVGTISTNLMHLGTAAVETTLKAKGRHDPCVLPRAVPVVEAMTALVLLDQLLLQKAQCDLFPVDSSFTENRLGKKLDTL